MKLLTVNFILPTKWQFHMAQTKVIVRKRVGKGKSSTKGNENLTLTPQKYLN